ncbi:hypothetical protein IE53DRAFT_20748 [Violaceomyces palustris]|uniref:Uncharacterized protein n=1 Tax=Violaceomyces palustris TaxID=1673888 RepID=A0ACD0P203_9BASI|nr:hypothetical protein IE53DRAFT_20748 [Violaceomyces palustris]
MLDTNGLKGQSPLLPRLPSSSFLHSSKTSLSDPLSFLFLPLAPLCLLQGRSGASSLLGVASSCPWSSIGVFPPPISANYLTLPTCTFFYPPSLQG